MSLLSDMGRTGSQAADLTLGREAISSNVEILCNMVGSTGPKTFERLVHDLYRTGWTIPEVKALLDGVTLVKPASKPPAKKGKGKG